MLFSLRVSTPLYEDLALRQKYLNEKNKKIFWFFLDKKISINYHNHVDEKTGMKK